jgi:hypothetical protein
VRDGGDHRRDPSRDPEITMKTVIACSALMLLAAAGGAAAQSVTFSASGPNVYAGNNNPLSASVTFTVSGSNLLVQLTNTATSATLTPSDVLTGLLWTMSPNTTLMPVSAVLGSGASMLYYTGSTTITPTTNIGGEYAYGTSFTGGLAGFNHGISAAGLSGTFGNGNPRFGSTNLVGQTNVGGLDFGLLGSGSLANANNGVLNSDGLVQSSVVFTLSGLGSNFNLDSISDIRFFYGTGLAETQLTPPGFSVIPLPPAAMTSLGTLLGLGAISAFRRRR